VALYPGFTISAEELVEHCRGLLARIKIPTRVDILDTLPKNAVGKVDKPALRATPQRAV
jgi:acyl-CoA synthetase (AMP-forming)/AMP-acid ligase II